MTSTLATPEDCIVLIQRLPFGYQEEHLLQRLDSEGCSWSVLVDNLIYLSTITSY